MTEQPTDPDRRPLRRLMLCGASGTGKSTLAAELAAELSASRPHSPVFLLHLDPGRALEGTPPGSIALARWEDHAWWPLRTATLASLDALKHRVVLLGELAAALRPGLPERAHVILDTPGVLRGQVAREWLTTLARQLALTRAICLHRPAAKASTASLIAELEALGVEALSRQARAEASRPSRSVIHALRWARWRAYVGPSPALSALDVQEVDLFGALEPSRQSALEPRPDGLFALARDRRGHDLGLVLVDLARSEERALTIEHAPDLVPEHIASLLARDMVWHAPETIKTYTAPEQIARTRHQSRRAERASAQAAFTPRARAIHRVDFAGSRIRAGSGIRPIVVGHLFEDPMVLLRLAHRQRCMMFDLGEARQVPTRWVHQTSDIFLSHAHLDHFGDFPWLLRRLAGHTVAIRVYGPPGIIERVTNMVHAFTWDRVGERGARFEVREVHDDHMERAEVRAGAPRPSAVRAREPRPGGVIRDEPRQIVRALVLDHGGLASVAYSVEEPRRFAVRGDVLKRRGWPPGPWLGELKQLAAQRRFEQQVSFADQRGEQVVQTVRALHDEVLIGQPGQKIVYATDFSTAERNREALVAFAQGADVFFCEATFAEADREQAERTGHLCAVDAAEIARAAEVNLLVPFHLSVRYESAPQMIYEEILARFERVLIPSTIAVAAPSAPCGEEES